MVRDTHDKPTQDNEDPWKSIGLQAALIINKLRCAAQLRELAEQEKIQGEQDREPKDADEKRNDDQRRYVEQRLRETAAWEAKFRKGKL